VPISRGVPLSLVSLVLVIHTVAAEDRPRIGPTASGIESSESMADREDPGPGPEAQGGGSTGRGRDEGLGGAYRVEGREPSGQTYSGRVLVVRRGDVYHIAWKLGDTQSIGTGLVDGNVLAVIWVIRGAPIPGVAVYEIAADGSLAGRYTMLGADVVGEERWVPVGAEAR
jgi:hypothetical protein